jgi:Uma2 family endonuclease
MASNTTIPKRRILKTLFTAEELLHLPSDSRRLELVNGKIYEMPPANGIHTDGVRNAASILSPYVRRHRLGRTQAGDPGFILRRTPDTVRAPGVAFISYDRLPA